MRALPFQYPHTPFTHLRVAYCPENGVKRNEKVLIQLRANETTKNNDNDSEISKIELIRIFQCGKKHFLFEQNVHMTFCLFSGHDVRNTHH